jgi:uncharacterized protein YbaR (Trm112 family)
LDAISSVTLVLDTPAEALIVCPETKQALYRANLAAAERSLSSEPLSPRGSGALRPFGPTPTVLVRQDAECAYPVVDDAPVLLAPEMLTPSSRARDFDLTDPKHAEAYEEMPYYNRVSAEWRRGLEDGINRGRHLDGVDPRRASDDPVEEGLRLAALAAQPRRKLWSSFPHPPDLWLHLRYESMALLDAYRHLAPLQGKRVLQIGGIGLDAVKFLLGGAHEAWLVSPMVGELGFARTLARACGIEPQLQRVIGAAEELPFRDASFDAVFAGGSVHHTLTNVALPECARVLKPGGVFASVEPWRGPGYVLGTRLLGKREPVACHPMNKGRVEPLFRSFASARVVHHGALTRYALIALWKLGITLPMSTVHKVTLVDDSLCSILPPLRRTGSSVALLASRAPAV